MDMKYSMVFHLKFVNFVVRSVFIDDDSCDIGIPVYVIDCEFSEAIAIQRFVCLIDGNFSVS